MKIFNKIYKRPWFIDFNVNSNTYSYSDVIEVELVIKYSSDSNKESKNFTDKQKGSSKL